MDAITTRRGGSALVALTVVFAFLFIFGTTIVFGATTGTLVPLSEGTYTSWTPKTGSTHYTMVDETTCNGTTDYVSETTAGERDSFGVSLASVPDGATITSIALTPCASRNSNGGGSSVMNVFYRYNGANSAVQGSYALTGTTPLNLATTNYSGLSLVKAGTDTLEVGAVYTSGNKGARLSRLATVITYTPAPPPVPTVTTLDPYIFVGTTTSLVLLNGEANPNGTTSTGWFRFDTTDPGTCNDTFGTRAPTVGGIALGGGTSTVAYQENVTGLLSSGNTYYYCALASNSSDTGVGTVKNFVAP